MSQIALFSTAACIVGASGSGMLNCVFAPERASVLDMESFTHTVSQHARIYGSTGKRYGFCFGNFADERKPDHIRSWRCSVEHVLSGLDALSH
jgi:capsular polysaccharide biosynthesis protein